MLRILTPAQKWYKVLKRYLHRVLKRQNFKAFIYSKNQREMPMQAPYVDRDFATINSGKLGIINKENIYKK